MLITSFLVWNEVILSEFAVTIPVIAGVPSLLNVAILDDPIKSINPTDRVPIPEPFKNWLLINFIS